MKRIISVALLLVMCLSLFAGCAEEKTSYDLEGAKKYLEAMYLTTPDTPLDYTLVGVVSVKDVTYNVVWSCDNADVIITPNGKIVNVDVPDAGADAIKYVLTATITAPDGSSITSTLNRRVPASASAGKPATEIVDEAYALEDGAIMENVTLTGKIVKLVAPINPQFNSMRFTIAVEGREDKPILCYNITGDLVSNDICVGDTATVTGNIKNYQGTIEFDTDCVLTNLVSGGAVKPTDSKAIVDEAFALAAGTSMPYFVTLSGKIVNINEAYSASYGNITVSIAVDGSDGLKVLKCYRMKGVGADKIAVGDTITVTGLIKNYQHSSGDCEVEFDSGCTMSDYVKGDGTIPEIPDLPETPDTPDTPDDPITPPASGEDAAIADGSYIIADNKGSSFVGGKCPGEEKTYGYLYDDYAAADKNERTIYTITSVGDGKYTIQDCYGKYLGVSGTYRSFQLYTTNEGDNCLWTICNGTNGEYVIQNVSNSRYIDYSEGFSSFGVYLENELPEDGMISLFTPDNVPSVTPDEPEQPENPNPPVGTGTNVADGNYVLYAPAYNKALSSTYNGYYNNGVDVTVGDGTVSGYGNSEIWTITNNDDGTISISINGKNLAMGDSFSSMPLGEKNDKWVLEDAGNGLVYVKNVARGCYIEWYAAKSNWSGFAYINEGTEGMFALMFYAV